MGSCYILASSSDEQPEALICDSREQAQQEEKEEMTGGEYKLLLDQESRSKIAHFCQDCSSWSGCVGGMAFRAPCIILKPPPGGTVWALNGVSDALVMEVCLCASMQQHSSRQTMPLVRSM